MNKRDIEAIYPLTPVQQGMLYGALADNSMYVEQIEFALQGHADPQLMERSWNLLADRHPMLRTGFVWKDREQPLQFVLKGVSAPFSFLDLSEHEDAARDEALSALRVAQCAEGFVLSRAPLYRTVLVKLGAARHVLLWTVHHVLIDGWCNSIIIGELLACYAALRRQGAWAPAPARPYRDYVTWLDKQDRTATEEFWRNYLKSVSVATIPGVVKFGTSSSDDHATLVLERGVDVTQGIGNAMRSRQTTWASLLHASWAVMLSWASGDRWVSLGTTVGARPAELPGIETTIGPFINSLPLVAHVDPARSWREFVLHVQTDLLAVRQFGHCTTGQVHAWSSVPRGAPLFESLMVFENYPMPSSDELASVDLPRLVELSGDGGRTAYPVSVIAAAADFGLRIKLIHARDRIASEDANILLLALSLLIDHAEHWLSEDVALSQMLAALDDLPRPAFVARPVLGIAHIDEADQICSDALEQRVADTWGGVLGVARIPVNRDFFSLGGHSLLATELLAAMRKQLGVEISLARLFEHSSVRAMANWIRAQPAAEHATTTAEPEQLVHDAAARFASFPLTDIQQAYWIGRSDAVAMGNVATHSYTEIDAADVDTDQARFEAALTALIERHDMLRAVFDDQGQQRVLAQVPQYALLVHDLRGESEAMRKQRLESIRSRMSHEVLASDRWPLFAIEVSRLDERRSRIHLSVDMLIVDGGSQQLLIRDFIGLYLGLADQLPPLRVTFRDYVLQLQRLRASASYERAHRYWHKRVPTLPASPELPLAIDPQTLSAPRFARRRKKFSVTQWETLRGRAKKLGVSDSMLLCGVYAEVLRTWSRRDNFCINLTLFDRRPLHEDVAHMVGDFTSTSILEYAGDPHSSLGERLRQLQKRMWTDMDHSLFSGVEVLRELNRRGTGGSRVQMPVVFTSGLVFAGQGDAAQEGAGVLFSGGSDETGEDAYSIGQTSQVWMDLMALNVDGGLLLMLDAVEDLFGVGMLDAFFDALCGLVERISEDPAVFEQRTITLLPEQQLARRRLVNDTARSWQIPALHAPALAPGNAGVAVFQGDLKMEFSQLRAATAQLAQQLRSSGLRHGDHVGIVMYKGWEQVVAALAVLALGGIYVPVDAHQPAARRRALLDQVGAAIVLCQANGPDDGFADAVTRVEVGRSLLDAAVIDACPSTTSLDDVAYVIFTSGSTGQPKGVVIDHRGASNTCIDINERLRVDADDRVLALSALNFDLSVYDIFGVLGAGGAMVIPDAQRLRDPEHWLELIVQHRVTIINAVPALVQMLVDHLEVNLTRLPESVRLVMMSGDWIPLTLPERLRACAGARLELLSLGGATEASIWSIAFPIETVAPHWRSIPYGKPLANQTFHVLRADLSLSPENVVGDLYIGGVGLALGYFGDAERTAQSFIIHPQSGERLYRTGDLGRVLINGNIEFLGREDGQVKVQGHRIELAEVEAHLLSHPDVQEAIVDARGQGGARALYAWVVTAEREIAQQIPQPFAIAADAIAAPTDQGAGAGQPAPHADEVSQQAKPAFIDALQEHLRVNLPEYMIPRGITVIAQMPLTANGKIDRKALPDPESDQEGLVVTTALAGEVDEALAALWKEVLGVSPRSREDNFVMLGGNSISLVQVITRLRARHGVQATLRQLFENPTFGFMRELMQRATPTPDTASHEEAFLRRLRELRLRHWVASMDAGEVQQRLSELETEEQ